MPDWPSTDVGPRVKFDGAIAFGPTQAALLEAILLTGSISAAQRQLGFLVAALNNRFSPHAGRDLSRWKKGRRRQCEQTRSSGSHRFPPDGAGASRRELRGTECD